MASFDNTVLSNMIPVAKPKSNSHSSLFPVLVMLFVVSYVLLTLLVVEQNRTIQAQRSMIQLLLGDSVQLAHMKSLEIQRQHHLPPSAKAAPGAQIPTDKFGPSKEEREFKNNRMQKMYPPKLPKGMKDVPDSRRNLDLI